jgi:hypothetical protein
MSAAPDLKTLEEECRQQGEDWQAVLTALRRSRLAAKENKARAFVRGALLRVAGPRRATCLLVAWSYLLEAVRPGRRKTGL